MKRRDFLKASAGVAAGLLTPLRAIGSLVKPSNVEYLEVDWGKVDLIFQSIAHEYVRYVSFPLECRVVARYKWDSSCEVTFVGFNIFNRQAHHKFLGDKVDYYSRYDIRKAIENWNLQDGANEVLLGEKKLKLSSIAFSPFGR